MAAVQSLNVQAALGMVRQPERTQFSHLIRHFLERFFNHETASSTGDGQTRLVQIACATGLPGLAVAMYLWPVYHPFIGWPPGQHPAGAPSYWVQMNHHFFFVMYSFVVMGLMAVFEWDLFFPDLLDVFILGTLPIKDSRLFLARVCAILLLVGGSLINANILAILILPLSADPPELTPFLFAHFSAVVLAGLFSAGFVLAVLGLLLAVLGEKLFRRISLLLQGFAVAGFLILLLLFPVISGVTPALLQANGPTAQWFPPFWFLAVFERSLPGATLLSTWPQLADKGILATALVWGIACMAYPVAHMRRVRALVLGTSSRRRRSWIAAPGNLLLHATVLRSPLRRAVFHFISQTILRIPRYRIYLVLYGGAGLSLVTATILRLNVREGVHEGMLNASYSADGIRAAIGIIAFWVVAGLRNTLVSPGNRQGGWIFRSVHGRPPDYSAALPQLQAPVLWLFLCSSAVTLAAVGAFQRIAPAALRSGHAIAAQVVAGLSVCLLLSDAFLLNNTKIPFTGEPSAHESNIAFTVLRYYSCFPVVLAVTVVMEHGMERGALQIGIVASVVFVLHLWLRKWSRDMIRLDCSQVAVEEDEDDFPLRLGLRY
jgi:hypothetical protein